MQTPDSWYRVLWLALLVGVAVGLLDVGGDFVLDDPIAIEQSVCVTGPLDLRRILSSNFWCEQGQWRSIQSWRPWPVLVWWFVWRLGPGSLPFTLLNVALHATCIHTVHGLGRDLGLPSRARAVGTLVFASLAIHVDAVAPAVGASELWSALFVLMCVRAYLRGSAWCIPLGGLALLSKESGVLAFAWLGAAFVFWPRARNSADSPRVLRGILLVGLGVVTLAVLALRAQVLGAWLGTQIPAFVNPLVDADLLTRATAAVALVGRYHRVTLAAGPLSADYAHAAIGIGDALPALDLALGILALIGWTVLVVSRRFDASTRLLAAWVLGTSIFVSNALFVLPAMFAERLFYLPTAAIALLLGFAADRALASGRIRPSIVNAGIVAFVAAQAAISSLHTLRYRSEETIVRHTVETTPGNARARMWLALRLLRGGDPEAARPHVIAARAVRPEWGLPRAVEGVLADLGGEPSTALAHFQQAMVHEPHDPEVADLFIQFLLRHGHVEPARAVYQAHSAARGQPDPNVTVP